MGRGWCIATSSRRTSSSTSASGRALVTDFGIARLAQAGGETAVGEVLGTPEYMSPPSRRTSRAGGRAQRSLFARRGGLLHDDGRAAVHGEFGARDHRAAGDQDVAECCGDGAREFLDSIALAIDKCLAKDPADRFERGEALAEALSPSLTKSEEVPVPNRVFLDRRRMMQLVMTQVVIILGGADGDVLQRV